MVAMAQKHTFIFPGQNPTQLKSDPFLGAKIMQHVEDWILREAERWDHAWRFLLNCRNLPLAAYDLFKAAESVSVAMNRMQNMLAGFATMQRDLVMEMVKRNQNGDKSGATRLGKKIVRELLKRDLWGNEADWPAMPDETRRVIELWKSEGKRQLLKRHGRKGLEPQPFLGAAQHDPEAYLMASNWLRWGDAGEPGLCYYSDEALADLMVLLSGQEKRHGLGTRLEYYRKFRQRLGLKQAYYRKPLVTKARRAQTRTLIEIELTVNPQTLRHTLFGGQAMVINGRQYYPMG